MDPGTAALLAPLANSGVLGAFLTGGDPKRWSGVYVLHSERQWHGERYRELLQSLKKHLRRLMN